MGFENNYDLMDQSLFPNDSTYIFKENPKRDAPMIQRFPKSDDEIISAVSAEMMDMSGEEIGVFPNFHIVHA